MLLAFLILVLCVVDQQHDWRIYLTSNNHVLIWSFLSELVLVSFLVVVLVQLFQDQIANLYKLTSTEPKWGKS